MVSATKQKKVRVVLLGGGFAGCAAAKALAARDDLEALLVDRENHHLFQPLLYQVATAGLSPSEIAQPLRHIFSNQSNLTTIMSEVRSIDLKKREITISDRTMLYDYLLIGLGVQTGYFGNNHWAAYAPGLKTIDEATELRRRLLLAFEKAEASKNAEEIESLMTFVVVGGGPTGVELAGAIAELARYVLAKEFRRIEPEKAIVHLIEAGPRLVPAFKEKQSEYTRQRLERMGVHVHLNLPVSDVSDEGVVAGGEKISAATVLWAAGVEGNSVVRELPEVPLDRAGRVEVNVDLSMPGYPEVYLAGDIARVSDVNGVLVPGVAPAAGQMGKHAARQILRQIDGFEPEGFKYWDKGNMATIGRSSAITEVGKFSLRGYLAWLAWLGVHLVFLLGMRNRISVFIHWVWGYFTWQRGSRIISKKLPSSRAVS